MAHRYLYLIIGICFGLGFPIAASAFLMFSNSLPFSISSLIELQQTNPLLWMIDTAPVFLGALAFFAGIKQDDLKNINHLLEEKVSREQKIARKWELAKQHAEDATLKKSEFLSIMSHEIRTPLNAVLGVSQLLSNVIGDREDRQVNEYLDALQFSGENLLALVNDILDFSKIEAGKVELDIAEFDLMALVKRLIEVNRVTSQKKQLDITHSLPDRESLWLEGDSIRIGQIVSNLLSNAVKFTEEGEIRVGVLIEAETRTHLTFRLEVKDTGIGISEQQKARIFDSFAQAHSGIHTKFGGSGLGLAITRRLLELHDSELNLDSEMLKGSSFSFEITMPKATRQYEKKSEDASMGNLPFQLKGCQVLVAEDNPINFMVARELLKTWDAEVYEARNGAEALEMAKKQPFNIILMDLQMPVMDGFEATAMIRQLTNDNRNIPILALSAFNQVEVQQQMNQADMDGFLQKPLQKEVLHEEMKRQCAIHRARQEELAQSRESDMLA